jgi:hypothetical protein
MKDAEQYIPRSRDMLWNNEHAGLNSELLQQLKYDLNQKHRIGRDVPDHSGRLSRVDGGHS